MITSLDNHAVLHEFFEAQAKLFPERTAVAFAGQKISYLELDARANQLARALRSRGIKRGATVAMLLPRSFDAYVAILGILKAGGAYVPIDAAYPADRIAWILQDSETTVLITETALSARCTAFRGTLILVDGDCPGIAAQSPEALPRDELSATPADLCYVIYTSGSTGRPKGVMVEHRNACHLVQAERTIFQVHPDDKVYQGASLCFDLSVEEIWLAWAAGATLAAATAQTACAGLDLARYLVESGVTVLSCVPTLLSTLDPEAADLSALRLLILGGEACPQNLAGRWARPGRRIVNTYGPTETTVIATFAEVSPGKPVTIGRPVPGYRVYLLDDHMQPVPAGVTGELCIGGPGVARGYLRNPAETESRFVCDPFQGDPLFTSRMYRTGDLGRLDNHGNIEFAGRADGQVKLRGLRIELGEIEAAMLRCESVQAAACVVSANAFGDPQLVGFVVPRSENGFNDATLREQLRNWLPAWMVPSRIETLADFPRLPSGKLDRALLAIVSRQSQRPRGLPGTDTESLLREVWCTLFDSPDISVDDDFFLDLGGHSLLAARMVSEMRKTGRPEFASVTLRDVYSHPTLSRLATLCGSRCDEPVSPEIPRAPACEVPGTRHFAAGLAQTLSLYFVFAVRGVQWLGPWLVYFLQVRSHSRFHSLLCAVAAEIAVLPIVTLIAVCAKWLLLGRVREGRHPLWGGYYLRWWFVQTLVRGVPLARLGGTPLLPFVYRLFGVRIGSSVHIASDLLAAFDVITIGEGSSIDEGASLSGYTVADGHLVIGPVAVGSGCLVGTRSVVCPGAVLEDGARLEDLSLLQGAMRVPAGETWSGSPAQKRHAATKAAPSDPRHHGGLIVLLYAALVLAFPLIEIAPFLPGVAILARFNPAQWLFYLTAPLAGAAFIVCVTVEVVLLKWLLIGRAREGTYPVHGWFYVRNWIVEQLLAFGLDVAGPLHSTVFLKPWYRALGAKLGRFTELSTASTTTPDLLDIGQDCTIADEVSLGAARVEKGCLTLARTTLGNRVFVGNSAVIPAGTTLGSRSLLGVLTMAPADREKAARTGAAWLGSPPIFLARRESSSFPEQTTFRPPRKLHWARGFCELFRITLPGAGFVGATVCALDAARMLWVTAGPAVTLLSLPAIFAACCAGVMLAVVPVKWLVVGRYRRFERPFWSAFVWRLEFVNALFEFLATPIGLETLRGTPLLPWYLRLLGCRIGRRVYIDTTGFLEFDLVDVGDRAILNADCILQTHLFEDRILKGSTLRIGADCEIGTQSIVLYDTEMEPGARLGPLSLLMKGEVLPAGRAWVGSPLNSPGWVSQEPIQPGLSEEYEPVAAHAIAQMAAASGR